MDFFSFETYQDVRKNLFYYSIPILVIAGAFFYFFILPLDKQKIIFAFFTSIVSTPIFKDFLGGISIFVIFVGLAFLLVEIFQIHDHWYDKFIIRWRHRYDLDFILPRLVQPFGNLLNYRFFQEAEVRTTEFMAALYYPFVADRDLKIPKNKLVRFYEEVTRYWLTQINEIVLILLTASVFLYAFFGPKDQQFLTKQFINCIILLAALLLNRLLVQRSLAKVRYTTADEIMAIHDKPELFIELKSKLKKLCSDYKIYFNE